MSNIQTDQYLPKVNTTFYKSYLQIRWDRWAEWIMTTVDSY